MPLLRSWEKSIATGHQDSLLAELLAVGRSAHLQSVERWDWHLGNRLRFTASYSPFSPSPPPQRFPPTTVRATVAAVRLQESPRR